MDSSSSGLRLLAFVLLVLGMSGCAQFAGRAAGRATPGVIEGSLQTLDDPVNRETIRRLLTSPEVQEGAREFAKSLADGAFSHLTEEEQAQRIEELTRDFTAAFVSSLLATAAEEPHRAAMNRIAREVSNSAAQGFVDGFLERVGPEQREMFTNALRELAHDVSRDTSQGVMVGVSRALQGERQVRGIGQEETLLSRMKQMFQRGSQLIVLVAAALGLVLMVLFVVTLRTGARHRREQAAWAEERRAIREQIASMSASKPVTAEMLAPLVARMLRDPAVREALTREPPEREPPPPTH